MGLGEQTDKGDRVGNISGVEIVLYTLSSGLRKPRTYHNLYDLYIKYKCFIYVYKHETLNFNLKNSIAK